MIDAQAAVAASNALGRICAYCTTPAVAALLMARQRFTGTAPPLWEGSMLDGTIMGFRAMSSAQMPSAKMIFGDWTQMLIGEWGVLELSVNPAANFPAGVSSLRAIYTNLVLNREETRTVLRIANADAVKLWTKGPAAVRQEQKGPRLRLVTL